MIREKISEELKRRNESKKHCAIELGFIYQNFNAFLNGKRQFPISDIEKVLKYLDLDIKN